MTRIIGLTGGIATGKSTVSAMLQALGAEVIDADAIVHELQAPGMPLLDEIAAAFGPGVLTADGALDREALGRIVFTDEAARKRLGDLVHPQVGLEMARRLAAAKEAGVPIVVLDIPLLLEGRARGRTGASALPFELVVLVYAREEQQLSRQLERNDYGEDEARRRIASQLSIEKKRSLADRVIDNSGAREETRAQVEALYRELTAGADREAAP